VHDAGLAYALRITFAPCLDCYCRERKLVMRQAARCLLENSSLPCTCTTAGVSSRHPPQADLPHQNGPVHSEKAIQPYGPCIGRQATFSAHSETAPVIGLCCSICTAFIARIAATVVVCTLLKSSAAKGRGGEALAACCQASEVAFLACSVLQPKLALSVHLTAPSKRRESAGPYPSCAAPDICARRWEAASSTTASKMSAATAASSSSSSLLL
jgi:hypothetical protein